MIVFDAAAAPSIRAGEALIAGRRLAGRLFPCGADSGSTPYPFDPVDRRFALRRNDVTVHVGPADRKPWADALARLPSGPVLVGPGSSAGEAAGACAAAVEAALASGRPVYLFDPEPATLGPDARRAVALCSWRPGRPAGAFPGLAPARAAGLTCAAVFPLLPGWTAEPFEIEALVSAAAEGGAAAVSALAPCNDGEGRRAIVQARTDLHPEDADRFFALVHHGDWTSRLAPRLDAARAAAERLGLGALPPRPTGWREPPGNAAAAAVLEEEAELSGAGDHRVALLHAAVRWIDECGRNLAALEREGNFRKIFPFAADIADRAAAALRSA